MQTTPDIHTYQGYRGLPPLAGLASMREAAQPGLSVEESVRRLKRHHWALQRLHRIFTGRLTAEPVYELKMAFSLHAHLCAEHIAAVRDRVREMRTPPLGLDESPSADLDLFFDEIQCAPDTESLVAGLYEKAVPALVAGLQRHLAATHRLFDHPTWRVCRLALVEMEDIASYGRDAVAALLTPDVRTRLAPWLALLDQALAACGGMDGTEPARGAAPGRLHSATPYRYDPVPRRDERFQDGYNMGVNAEAFLHDPRFEARPKSLMLYFKRMREIDVPEMMASIIMETPDKPWAYYRDLSRQLWDEARHAMMGEVGFTSLGVDWREVPLNFTWSLQLNTKLQPHERHAVLFSIEQGLMPADTGKKMEYDIADATRDPLLKEIQDYDWADEILHARIGRDWFVKGFGALREAEEFGGKCWSRALQDWGAWKEQGLTQHRNWWPDVYRAACRHWAIEPDPAVLAWSETYENKRADLKPVAPGYA